jgi:hypothetical protein
MKFFRTITVILILALVTSPALAAICATSCASKSMMSTVNSDDMSGMMHCHKGSTHKESTGSDKSSPDHSSSGQSGTEHKSCAMGAGCHFAQATPVDSTSKYTLIDASTIAFPRFDSAEKSVDLSPPLKPPA